MQRNQDVDNVLYCIYSFFVSCIYSGQTQLISWSRSNKSMWFFLSFLPFLNANLIRSRKYKLLLVCAMNVQRASERTQSISRHATVLFFFFALVHLVSQYVKDDGIANESKLRIIHQIMRNNVTIINHMLYFLSSSFSPPLRLRSQCGS